jgi:hypothetical protein
MNIHDTLGEFRGKMTSRAEFLTLTFTPYNGPLRDRWRNNGRSADFLGDCVAGAYLSGPHAQDVKRRRAELRAAVAFVSNELLENAVKFHDGASRVPISIRLEMDDETICVSARHAISAAQRKQYLTFIHHFLQTDTNELFLMRMEEAAREKSNGASGIGLLTMTNDYAANLGWRFESSSSQKGALIVTTQVQLAPRALLEERS